MWLGGEGGLLWIVQEIEFSPFYQMVNAQTWIRPTEWDTKNSLAFCYTNRSSNPDQKTRTSDSEQNKKKRKKKRKEIEKENVPNSGLCRLGGLHRKNQRTRKER